MAGAGVRRQSLAMRIRPGEAAQIAAIPNRLARHEKSHWRVRTLRVNGKRNRQSEKGSSEKTFTDSDHWRSQSIAKQYS